MPHGDSLAKHKPKIAVALILTFASGLVDIVGYTGVFHLFTAHVTGTTVHFGESLALRRWTDMLAALSILAAFFVGSVAGRAIIESGGRRRFRNIASVTLTIEAVMIAFVAAGHSAWGKAVAMAPGGAHTYLYLAVLSAAMGMQTATLTGVGPLTVHTTFVTGMVNKLAQLVSRISFRGYDFARGLRDTPEKRKAQSAESKQAIFIFCIWVFYMLGAAGGTASYMRWGFAALLVAIAGLVIGVATDLVTPLSVEEEKEQSER